MKTKKKVAGALFALTLLAGQTVGIPHVSKAASPKLDSSTVKGTTDQNRSGWHLVPKIMQHIKAPSFANQTFDITTYGAVSDGTTMNTDAFKAAIQAAHDAGGGVVNVPAGTYLTGAIHLLSNVNLHVSKDATILFSQDPNDYLPVVKTRFEGQVLMNYSPLIYAYGQKNVAITGSGTLDGNADNQHWWPWKGKTEYGWQSGMPNQSADSTLLGHYSDNHVPIDQRIFGSGHYLRPDMIEMNHCQNVLIQGVTIKRSPMWNIHPVMSQNVTVDGVNITDHGPNNDGIDPESDKYVLIENSLFDNGDDNIAIKSGKNEDGRSLDENGNPISNPSEDIIIQNNTMKDGHGAVVIGSEMSGSVYNVFARNNVMDSPNLDRVLRIKTNSYRGGTVDGIYLKNNKVKSVGEAVIKINTVYNHDDGNGGHIATIKNIQVKNMQSTGGKYGIEIDADARNPVQNLQIINSKFDNVQIPYHVSNLGSATLQNVFINGSRVTSQDLLNSEQ